MLRTIVQVRQHQLKRKSFSEFEIIFMFKVLF